MKLGPLSKRIYINEDELFGLDADKNQRDLLPFLELKRLVGSGHVMVFLVDNDGEHVFEVHRSDSIKMENWFRGSRRWWARKPS
jgi:hypothetical protein